MTELRAASMQVCEAMTVGGISLTPELEAAFFGRSSVFSPEVRGAGGAANREHAIPPCSAREKGAGSVRAAQCPEIISVSSSIPARTPSYLARQRCGQKAWQEGAAPRKMGRGSARWKFWQGWHGARYEDASGAAPSGRRYGLKDFDTLYGRQQV